MPREKLTDTLLRKAKPEEKEYTITDSVSGVEFRVTPSGTKIFGWRCKDLMRGNKQVRKTYGYYPDLSLADARSIHNLFASARKNGADIGDPNLLNGFIQQVTQKQRATLKSGRMTFAELVDFYFLEFVEANNKYPGPYNRIKNHLLPILKDHYVEQITDTTMADVIEQFRLKGCSERTKADAHFDIRHF